LDFESSRTEAVPYVELEIKLVELLIHRAHLEVGLLGAKFVGIDVVLDVVGGERYVAVAKRNAAVRTCRADLFGIDRVLHVTGRYDFDVLLGGVKQISIADELVLDHRRAGIARKRSRRDLNHPGAVTRAQHSARDTVHGGRQWLSKFAAGGGKDDAG